MSDCRLYHCHHCGADAVAWQERLDAKDAEIDRLNQAISQIASDAEDVLEAAKTLNAAVHSLNVPAADLAAMAAAVAQQVSAAFDADPPDARYDRMQRNDVADAVRATGLDAMAQVIAEDDHLWRKLSDAFDQPDAREVERLRRENGKLHRALQAGDEQQKAWHRAFNEAERRAGVETLACAPASASQLHEAIDRMRVEKAAALRTPIDDKEQREAVAKIMDEIQHAPIGDVLREHDDLWAELRAAIGHPNPTAYQAELTKAKGDAAYARAECERLQAERETVADAYNRGRDDQAKATTTADYSWKPRCEEQQKEIERLKAELTEVRNTFERYIDSVNAAKQEPDLDEEALKAIEYGLENDLGGVFSKEQLRRVARRARERLAERGK